MTRLLALTCGLLASVVAAEWFYGQSGAAAAMAGPAAAVRLPPLHAAAAPAPRPIGGWVSTILARPVFAIDRRPQETAGSGSDQGLPRLTGIIAAADDAVAIFQPSGGGKPVAVRSGDTVDGWAVGTIGVDAVSLTKADDRVVLRPHFENAKAGHAVVAAAPKGPSRWEVAASSGMLRARWSNPQLQP